MVKRYQRPGRMAKVYLRPLVNGALDAYREKVCEETGESPAVNAILLERLEVFLVEEGFLYPSMIKSSRSESTKETT